MKILLSTIIDNVNYGTYLQSYATVSILQRFGAEVDILNYTRPHLTATCILKDAAGRGAVSALKAIPAILMDSLEKRNVAKFTRTKCNFTFPFSDWEKAKKNLKDYDLYLTGSDQVWNLDHNRGLDPAFFFEGIKGVKKSFAASIGTDYIDPDLTDHFQNLLNGYSFISVRETQAVKALEDIGIRGAVSIIDPTLMLTHEEWMRSCESSFKREKPYLLIYSVEKGRIDDILAVARKIAAERGLQVCLVTPYPKLSLRKKVDKLFAMADTDTFLKLFSEADYAVVSSFHGTAFAINFNKQFVSVSPERFNSRVKSLLEMTGLEDRYVTNAANLPQGEIDYAEVNRIIDNHRRSALDIVKNKIVAKENARYGEKA